jgi:hypothetical protein
MVECVEFVMMAPARPSWNRVPATAGISVQPDERM